MVPSYHLPDELVDANSSDEKGKECGKVKQIKVEVTF